MGIGLFWALLLAACALVLPVALKLILTESSAETERKLARMRSAAPRMTDTDLLLLRAAEADGGSKQPFLRDMQRMTETLGLPVSGRGFLLCVAVAALAFGILTFLGTGSALLALGLAGSVALTAVAVLRARHAAYVDRFVTQLPDALDLMMRGLRIGHPISATISNVARTMPDPIGAEFRVIEKKIGHGDYLTDALSDLADKIDQEDMHYLAVSIRIQHGTGGNLADMLATLSGVIRSRIMLRRRVRALSSEGRISSLLLSSLPLVIFGATSLMAPDYYGAVSDDPLFLPIACTIVALVVANFLILRRLVNFQA